MKPYPFYLFFVLFTSLISGTSFGQNPMGVISGIITDTKGAGVPATISLIQAADSMHIKSLSTDKAGVFVIENLASGLYLLKVTAIGHKSAFSEKIELGVDAIKLNPIVLKPGTDELAAVTVVSRKPMIEQKIDRMVVNVDAAVTNAGATALEVLEKTPGVQVDKDGNISLKGKQGIIILIDGRPAYLTGPELANMLQGMQATQLDQIEVMTNPPAKYDAAGNSGVINIKTKKNKAKGFNGNLSTSFGQGAYFKSNHSLNLNYRNNKINIFGTYSYASNNSYTQLDIFRRYKNEDESVRAVFEQKSLMLSKRRNNNLKAGLDYFLSKKTTLGIVFSGFYNPETDRGINTSMLKDPQANTDSIVVAHSNFKEVWKNGTINLNLRHLYDSTGRELTFDVDYLRYDAINEQRFTNTTYSHNWIKKYDEELYGDLPVVIDIYTAKTDYVHPFNKETKLEFGLKTSYVKTDNRANYFEMYGGEWISDYGKTNYFDYTENINAAYVNLNKQLTKKFGVQAGLRFENTNYKGYQYGNPTKTDSSFTNSYNSLFPTLYLSYALNETNQFGLNIGRRIDRPRYQNLNPFLFFIDKYTYMQGNPYLLPQFSNNVELSHIYKGMITTTINYGYTKNLFVETFDQPESNGEYDYSTIVRRGNIGKRENAGISVNAQLPIGKWFRTMIYTNYNYNRFEGLVNGEMVKAEAGNILLSVNNQFKFGKGWGAELSGWIRSKGVEAQLLMQPMGQLSGGISKQVLKGKGSVKLNVRDIFFTNQFRAEMNFKSTEAAFTNTRDSRVGNLTFTYRFGKPVNGNGQRKKGSSSEEQNRVGGD